MRRERTSRCEDASVTEQTLARARVGDEEAFRELTDPYRRELQVHIYRIVGSPQDAEDLLQETLLAAWRGLERFEGRASLRAWLYRIATNRSLDALRASRRRPEDLQRMTEMPEPTRYGERDLARALPGRPARGHPRPGSRTGGALRGQGGDRAGVHRRPSAPPAAAARGARAARRARVPRRRGRRDARHHRASGQQPRCAARGRRLEARLPASPTRTGAAPALQARARHRRPLRRRHPDRRHRRASSPCSPTTPG